jgi:hypothetical protein
MSIAGELKQMANDLARQAQARIPALKAELVEIDTQRAAVESQLNAAKQSEERASRFQSPIGLDEQCPDCWVKSEIRSPLYAIGADPDYPRADMYRCRTCRGKFRFGD